MSDFQPTDSDIAAVLRAFNPWWAGQSIGPIPETRREAFGELWKWIWEPPVHRAVLLSGARRVGKSTLLFQSIQALLAQGVSAHDILYATLDHPMLRLAGLDAVVQVWRGSGVLPGVAVSDRPRYLFLDEIQYGRDWQVWTKHQVDFVPRHRIVATGSASPLVQKGQESGVGRWHTIKVPTLSFREYLDITRYSGVVPRAPASLAEIFDWGVDCAAPAIAAAEALEPYFYDFLIRGGFPESLFVRDYSLAQKLLREDIVDRVLKRDVAALYGVRYVNELERLFLYICMHDGGRMDMQKVAGSLGISRGTVLTYLELLEASNLIYRLAPFGYGTAILRGKPKVYVADPGLGFSLLMNGPEVLQDERRMGMAVESSVFKHLLHHRQDPEHRLSYWYARANRREHEVDFVVTRRAVEHLPIEVKFRAGPIRQEDVRGLRAFCAERPQEMAIIVTRCPSAFEAMTLAHPERNHPGPLQTKCFGVPAPLLCYWASTPEFAL